MSNGCSAFRAASGTTLITQRRASLLMFGLKIAVEVVRAEDGNFDADATTTEDRRRTEWTEARSIQRLNRWARSLPPVLSMSTGASGAHRAKLLTDRR